MFGMESLFIMWCCVALSNTTRDTSVPHGVLCVLYWPPVFNRRQESIMSSRVVGHEDLTRMTDLGYRSPDSGCQIYRSVDLWSGSLPRIYGRTGHCISGHVRDWATYA